MNGFFIVIAVVVIIFLLALTFCCCFGRCFLLRGCFACILG